MIKNPIYKPGGRAREYGEWAVNIYTGCPHRCDYCFAPGTLKKLREQFHSDVRPRAGIVEGVIDQLGRGQIKDKLIHLCFTCDPYPSGLITEPTRQVIEAIKESGNHVQILTKGGFRANCDFDLLGGNDWLGVTISGYSNEREPGAASWEERLSSLQVAHRMGIKTWISCEPVLRPDDILNLIERLDWVDLFKIGKLNHERSDIDWRAFGEKAEWLCQTLGRPYYIKDDLRKEMEKGA